MPVLQRRLPVAACLLSLLAGCGSGFSPTQPSAADAPATVPPLTPTPGFGAIEGRITDAATADPIAGARIDAVSGPTSFSVTSNTAGAFRMDLPPGTARVRAVKEGYVAYDKQHTIQSGAMTLELRLARVPAPPPTPTYTLTGLVIDVQSNPIAGASVSAYCCDSPVDGVVGRTSTDAAGRFTLIMTTTRVPGNVSVEKSGYQRARAPVAAFPPGSTGNVTIVMARDEGLTGSVSITVDP